MLSQNKEVAPPQKRECLLSGIAQIKFAPRNNKYYHQNRRKGFLPFLHTFCCFPCFQTPFLLFLDQKCLEMGENVFSHFWILFIVSPVSRYFFSYFQKQKCLEMGKNFSPISRHFLLFFLFLDTFSLISRPKMCLEIGEHVFSHFQTLLGLEIREKVSRNWRNGK